MSTSPTGADTQICTSSCSALDTAPVTWPVGRAAEFAGTYDLRARALHLTAELSQSDARLVALGDEVDLIRAALPEFDQDSFNASSSRPNASACSGVMVTVLPPTVF